jgi:predicted ATPase/class 3 adenylate cyclase
VAELPSGTVTFLFTDLEGSTRLWEEHPEAMKPALARHDQILRDAVEANAGHIVKTTGDGLHAVFADAADGVGAAVAAQRGLGAASWPVPEPVRVRMGLHTGAAELRGGDYYGPAVNRAARIMSAANGGQILASLATEEVVSEALPPDVELVDLGEHRLRDLARPQRLFQVCVPDLAREFAPIRTADARPGNLPAQLTSFIGRADEVTGITRALDAARLVTITGAGGMGKTRLALEVAGELRGDEPDGAWLCEVAPATDGDAMAQSVAATLGVTPRPGLSAIESIVDFLRPKRMILVLDNCEHLRAEAAELANAVLHGCPNVRILATSRVALDVSGEQRWVLHALEVPAAAADLDRAASSEAVRLFDERARSARRDFRLDEGNVRAVVEICRHLDGLPLALELAAARVSALGPVEIAALLDERFRLLSGGGDDRHHTLRATIDWSYSLLERVEQTVFDRLGVFTGTFDAESARAVVAGDGIEGFDVLDALTHLVGHSMVTAEPAADGTMRYELLESLREYAREHLGDDLEQWQRRHAEHYAEVAAAANVGFMTTDELVWRRRVAADLDNLDSAVSWGLGSGNDDAKLAATIVARLGWLAATSPWRVGDWAARVIECAAFPDAGVRYTIYGAAAHRALGYGDYRRACELGLEGVRDGIPPGAPVAHMTYNAYGTATAVNTGADEALAILERGIAAVAGGNPVDTLILEGSSAMVEAAYGRLDAGRRRSQRVLPLARATNNPTSLHLVLVALAWSTLDSDPDGALALLNEAIERARKDIRGSHHGIALSMAAELQCRRGDALSAIEALRETVAVNAETGDRGMLVTALERSVKVLVDLGEVETACVFVAALRPLSRAGALPATERVRFEESLTQARDALGPDTFAARWKQGAAMSLDDLVVYATDELDRIRAEQER